MSGMAGMYNMNDLLNLLAREGADEMHLEPDRPPVMLLQGKPRVMDGALITSDTVAALFRGIATEEQRRELELCGNIHFAYTGANSARFLVKAAINGEHLNLSIKNLGR
ncbi:MAG TPA: hypothetical protein VG167_04090 [Verrucomicrobiae bacterium]|nr:hypothetical protein [Verrucomicrobiae bacterium]